MKKYCYLLFTVLFIPLLAGAAPSTTVSNTYIASPQVSVTQPVLADFIAAGEDISIQAPVDGDILAAGATVEVGMGAGGDVRVAGAKVSIGGNVGGDVAAAGATVHIFSHARSIYAAGASVESLGGASTTVTIYGANVRLAGDYGGNVSVVASNKFTIEPGTHIAGALKYSAPGQVVLPASATIEGGANYTGTYAYVPTSKQIHQYALAGAGIFLIVRILAGVIVAGLIAGLFPVVSMLISEMVLKRDSHHQIRLLSIGLFFTVLAPILCLLLFISFVGAGLALLGITLYALLILLSYAFSGIVLGVLLRRTLLYRLNGVKESSWPDAILGTILIHVIGYVPIIGTILVVLISMMCAGALLRYMYDAAINTNHPRV